MVTGCGVVVTIGAIGKGGRSMANRAGDKTSVRLAKVPESPEPPHLGEMLVKQGKIRMDQLERALEVQRAQGGLIGHTLLDMGMISESEFAAALAEFLHLELIDLSKPGVVEPEAVRMLPPALARRYHLIAVRFADSDAGRPRKLVVAMMDPTDYIALDSIRALANIEPQPAIAPRSQISDALESVFVETPASLEQAIGELKDFKIEDFTEQHEVEDGSALQRQAGLAPVVRFVNSMLYEAARMKASDIHIEPQEHQLRCRFRVDGDLRIMSPPPKQLQNAIVSRIKIVSNLDIAEHRLPQDGRLKIRYFGRTIDVRVSTMPTVHGEKVVLRLLDQGGGELSLDKMFETDAADQMRRIISAPHGIVMLCGPTGCGKSSTLYAFVRELNLPEVNIVTVEDPVEYRLEGINQTHVRAKIGLTFANCLRTILRQDPDIVMVGEIRDLETLEVSVRASLTGHLVFSTLHTNTAVSAVTRMENMGLQRFLISATLLAAQSQRLLRRVCQHCRRMEVPTPATRELLERQWGRPVDFPLAKPVGCEKCGFRGYSGRVAVYEIFEPDNDLREMISQGTAEHLIEARALQKGMKNLQHNAIMKLIAGVTTLDEVLSLGFHQGEDAARLVKLRQSSGATPTEPEGANEGDVLIDTESATIIDLDKEGPGTP